MCTVQSSIQQCALSPSFWNIERLCLNSTFVSATTYKINFRTGQLVAYLDHLGDHVHLTEEECQLTTSSSGRCWLSNVLIDRFSTTPKLISGNYIWTWDNNIHVLYTDLCPKSSSFHYHRQSIETVDCVDPGELWDLCAPVLIESMRSQCCSCPMGGSSGQPSNPVRPRIQEGLKLTLLISHNHNPRSSAFLEDNYPAYYPAQLFAVHSNQNKTSIYFNSHNQRNSTRTPDALDTSHTPGVSDMADSPNAPCLCIWYTLYSWCT